VSGNIVASVVVAAQSDADYAAARLLFCEYAATLGVDLGFQGFDAELQQLPAMYGPPDGCLLLARSNGETVGCIAVRRWDAGGCEMKRLYVRSAARGGGLGRSLVAVALERARALGYRRMLLDTLAVMDAARRLYESFGFVTCEAYYHNPIAGAVYMALDLGAHHDRL
jgi:GNAT superfamily N-acetyltransferase